MSKKHSKGNQAKTVLCGSEECRRPFTISYRNTYLDAGSNGGLIVKATCPHCGEDMIVVKPDPGLVQQLQGQI